MADWNELSRDLASGDPRAVDDLLAAYLPSLRAFVRLRMGPELRAKESASDLVQSTCREILTHQARFEFGSEVGFRRWLFTTAARKVCDRVDHYRAEKRDVRREVARFEAGSTELLGALYADLVTPSQDAQGRELVARLEAAFDRLRPEHREVITLARFLGHSHREVGEAMGRSEAASRMLLSRALSCLAAELDPEGDRFAGA